MPHKIKDISETLFRWLSRISQDDYEYMPSGISDWDTKDWQVSKTIIFMHGMGPLWGYHITKGWSSKIMPLELSDYLEKQFYENTKRINLIYTSYHEIGQKLDEAKIKYLPFKGIVLAEKLYPHIGCRPMADIDIYTGAESAERVTKVMSDIGFVATFTAPSGITYYPKAYIDACLTAKNNNWVEATQNETRFNGENALAPFSVDVHFSMNIQNHWASFNLTKTFENSLLSADKHLPTNMMIVYFLLHADQHIIPHTGRWIQLHDLFLLFQHTNIDPVAINKIGRELGVSHLLLLPLVMCRKMFSTEKSALESLIEKEVNGRFKRTINKVELSTYSQCNPSDSLFSLLPWMLNIRAFQIALNGSQKERSENTLRDDTADKKVHPFLIRILIRVKNMLLSQPPLTWRLLAAHDLNPRKDWK